MHLLNKTPGMSDSQRDLRLSIWFSVLSLERTITIITGRPSMIRDIDCSVVPPPDGTIDPDKHLMNPTYNGTDGTRSSAQPANFSIPSGQTWTRMSAPAVAIDRDFFLRHVELSAIANSAVSELYCSHIRHSGWSDVQLTMRGLNRKLDEWNDNLPDPYDSEPGHTEPRVDSTRAAIGMLFHCTRVIINRPCHCRIDDRIADHSSTSDSFFNIDSAGQCVASAMGILALVPDQPDPAKIYQGPLWWLAFHHIKRAAAVLIQEITLRSENSPTKGPNVLADAKKAINWLHAMGTSSSPAFASWVTLSRLLVRATQRFGGDLDNVRIADEEKKEDSRTFAAEGLAGVEDQGHQPSLMTGIEGQDFQLGFGDLGFDYDHFGDLNFDAWDQFQMT